MTSRGWRWSGIGLIVVALGLALAPIPADVVERAFSTGFYPRIQRIVTPVANLVPFALFDLIVLVVVVTAMALGVAGIRRARALHSVRPIGEALGRVAVLGAAVYLIFLAEWGFNYRRVPMSARLVLAGATPSREAVRSLGMDAVRRMNALHPQAHAQGWNGQEWRDMRLRRAFTEARQLLVDAPEIVPGRLKWTIFGPYFRWSGVDGMVDPFALEVLVNPDLLPWERPFVAAHEWSHLAGFADESEANFVGWLTCVRGDEPAQYSGWLYLFWQVAGEVGRDDREALFAALAPGPRRDVDAILDRIRRGQFPLLRNASWVVYDQYLRANRVESGIRSYGEVITLILRARFEDGFRPVRAPSR